eukprot:519998_1
MKKYKKSHVALTFIIILNACVLAYYISSLHYNPITTPTPHINGKRSTNDTDSFLASDLTHSSKALPKKQLIIGIISRASNIDQRKAIRETWLKTANQNKKIKAFFYVGRENNDLAHVNENLTSEQASYNDIIIYNGNDTWKNLSKKVFAMSMYTQK